MGEAKRRKLAGNTEPNKQCHQRKEAKRHAHKLAVQERAAARAMNPRLK